MEMTKDLILNALPKLKRKDLEDIKTIVEHMLNKQHNADEPPEFSELYEVIKAATKSFTPYSDLGNTATIKTWRKNAPVVLGFITQNFPDVTKVMRVALMQQLVMLTVNYLHKLGVP